MSSGLLNCPSPAPSLPNVLRNTPLAVNFWMRLLSSSATYTLPDRWAAQLGASSARVSIAARELHTWTRYSGLEPEATYLGGARFGTYGNYEQSMLPQLARAVVAVSLGY